jgi:2-oxo-3-hexenedioate decarboxylase
MGGVDVNGLARELLDAYSTGKPIAAPPSAREGGLDMTEAYAVEGELARLRRARGRTTVGRKVGYANKATWRILKLDTLVWAHMYDDTVQYAANNAATLSLAHRYSPKIEPEIVMKLKRPVAADGDAASTLDAVEWLALGFEINDCLFPDWKLQPADFVAAFGLHTALVVGEPHPIVAGSTASLAEQLAKFTLRLLRNRETVAEGSGKNSLRSPALCLGELAAAIARRSGAEPLAVGELISTGTLTDPQPIADGEEWRAEVSGLDLPSLTVQITR